MNKAIKTKWLEALRSGKYEQTTAQLRNNNKFCCLGVLCDIRNKEGWDRLGSFRYYNSSSGSQIPIKLREKLGISFDQQHRLFTMNDKEGKSFTEIADYIEANL